MIFYRVILQKKVVLLNIQTWLKAGVLQTVKIGEKRLCDNKIPTIP